MHPLKRRILIAFATIDVAAAGISLGAGRVMNAAVLLALAVYAVRTVDRADRLAHAARASRPADPNGGA